ncbi:NAD-dependent epimerase/dehydratase family protein [Shimazuella kribbensis]|uniref:NAD-dependent epimerase/dehydratase family protein n=1 Tax=Shimazuella kribbensis TaxID=139808 RepID=UPI0003FAF9FA|nr:NAD-dependent epimerase/dehydratase family protein [Shimazuella kribbensis]
MKKVFVSGATGFLGRHVVNYYAKTCNVIGYGRNSQIGNELSANPNVMFKQGRLENKEEVTQAVQGCDTIIHCGALSSPFGKEIEFIHANEVGTSNLVETALQQNIERFIHISTPSLYFNRNSKVNVTEKEPLPPEFPSYYTKTKWKAEMIVQEGVKRGLPAVILRPRALFGEYDQTLVPRLLRANEKLFIPLVDHGTILTDVTYVKNVVHAIECSRTADEKYNGEVYNITNDEPKTIKEILDLLFEKIAISTHYKRIPKWLLTGLARVCDAYGHLTNIEPPFTSYTASLLCHHQTLNIEKAKKEIGYCPLYTLTEGIEHYVAWRKHQVRII